METRCKSVTVIIKFVSLIVAGTPKRCENKRISLKNASKDHFDCFVLRETTVISSTLNAERCTNATFIQRFHHTFQCYYDSFDFVVTNHDFEFALLFPDQHRSRKR